MDRSEATQIVYDYLRKTDEAPEHADAIYAFGSGTLASIKKAIDLWRTGLAPQIFFIGGKGGSFSNPLWESEAVAYREALIKYDVPEEAFRGFETHPCHSNTLDETRLILPFMREHGIVPKQVVLVSRPLHQRRAWATISKQWPDIFYTNIPADEPCDEDEETLQRMVSEIERLDKYAEKGDIVPQEVPNDVREATVYIKEILQKR